jgi:GNAT superfamily N-acetyltransferase
MSSELNDAIELGGLLTLALSLLAITLFLTGQFVPSWLLLARSLPRHGRANLSWQAMLTLLGLLVRGLQVLSLHKAARLRIEIELVNPLPDHPLRLNYRSKEDYRAAKKEWQSEKQAWKDHVDAALGALVHEEEDDWTIDIETCTPLIEDDDIARYFNALNNQLLRPNQQPVFLSKVTIRSGFVTPLHLLTGVLARYEDDWQPIVEGYGRSIIRPNDPYRYRQPRKMQAFIFDCWLLWGPSIPVCTCPEWRGEVALQYGYGDENNSLTLRSSSPEVVRTLARQNGLDLDGFALRARVTGTLKWGPALGDTGFCPAQHAIWQDNRIVLDIIGEAHGIRPTGGTEEQVFAQYYSAYLWVIFVMCDAETGEPLYPENKWRDLIPFFVHGNIADRQAYDFHSSALARGVFEGCLHLLQGEPNLTLRFVCAIDETACGYEMLYSMPTEMTIRKKMITFAKEADAACEDGAALQRLILEYNPEEPFKDGDYSACALPGIVNAYYSELREEQPTFHELRFARKTDIDLLRTFYEDCFVPEFPNPNERESFEVIQNYLRLKDTGWYKKNNYHVLVLLDGDKPIGGSISDYLDEPNAGVIEYFVIQPEHRGQGLGRRLLEETERLLHLDADKSRNRPLDWIVAEMDDPYVTPGRTSGMDYFALARIWHSMGYRLLDFPYLQPALSSDKKPVSNLSMIGRICSHRFKGSQVASADVQILLREYLQWAMRIQEPEKNDVFNRMREFLEAAGAVELVSFGDYLGWQKDTHLRINEVITGEDPELDQAIDVYERVFQDRDIAIASNEFRKAFQPEGLAYRPGYRFHLWTIRLESVQECGGMASFLTMPSAGFGGYIGFADSLRGAGKLRHIIARAEERMVRDGTEARGWYIECAGETERNIFSKVGFAELDVQHMQPALPGRSIEPRTDPLHLLYKPFGRVYERPTIAKPEFLQAMSEIYQSIYDIAHPDEDEVFIKLAKSLDGVDIIKPKVLDSTS